MALKRLQKLQESLEQFVAPLLPLFGRLERRKWGSFYLRGLLIDGGRKTASTMAEMYGGNEQALQQFISQSPWEDAPVRRELAHQLFAAASPLGALLIDDTGFPKKGTHSVGVARQYSGTLGKVGNCQIGVSVNYATDSGCFPIDFQLYLPEEWATDQRRRAKAGVPEHILFKRKWELALEMVDRAVDWGCPSRVIVADAGYGVSTEFRESLVERGFKYVLGITGQVAAWLQTVEKPARVLGKNGRPRKLPAELPPNFAVAEIARSLPATEWTEITWRGGTKGPMKGRFARIRVQPSHGRRTGEKLEAVQWLLIEWPPKETEPTKFWLSNLPETISFNELVYWAKIRWWIEQGYQHLKDELGLDHFEGRSWRGWHHHATLTMIAFGFLVWLGFHDKKNFIMDTAEIKARIGCGPGRTLRSLPDMLPSGSPA